MNATPENSIEKQLAALPPLPITVTKVLQVIANPDSSANDLVKAILPDPTMCVAILKIANSSLYGRPKKVSSLETAIVVLGFSEVQSIVLGKAAVTSFRSLHKSHKSELDTFWDHSFTCGLAAKIIADHLNLPSGQFFIAGLLHDIGKLAMLMAFGESYEAAHWFSSISTPTQLAAEKQRFSSSHDLIGCRLLQRWQFPDTLTTALGWHHTPGKAEKLRGYPLVIQLADFLSYMLIQPQLPDEKALTAALHDYLPEFEQQWRAQKLPWEEITLESWLAWLKVDREHGSSILDILAA